MRDDLIRSLWVNVLKVAMEDAVTRLPPANGEFGQRKRREREEARAWFSRKSLDFIEVCELAGFNPDDVFEKAATAIARCDELEAEGKHFTVDQPKATPVVTVPTYTHAGKTLPLREWAEFAGIPRDRLRYRLEHGVPFDRAIEPKPLPRSSSKHLKPRKAKPITVDGMSMTLTEWAMHLGMAYGSLVTRRSRYGTHEASIAAALATRRVADRGVAQDQKAAQATGGRTRPQETPHLTFSRDAAE